MAMGPFFRHLGSKYRTSAHYPAPQYETIIEPFAGGAGYATRYHRRKIVLVERDPAVARVWRYLINARPRDILALPDIPEGGSLDDLEVSPEVHALIARNLNMASGPCKRFTAWREGNENNLWGPVFRARLAAQIEKIRHWQLIQGDFRLAPNIEATWFIDPPYQNMGVKMYAHDADQIDFAALAEWCKSRRGQVIVCENADATWLPFRSFGTRQAGFRGSGHPDDGVSHEVIWTNG